MREIDMDKPNPPRPQCVEFGGSRADWDEYHITAALYYDGHVLTIDRLREIGIK